MERTIRSLTRHYPRRDDVVIQVLAVLDRFQGVLNPEQSDFTYDDGRVELLLSLTGVLPIPIQANTYHCPIVFWLPLDFPSAPPIVFILPSETLAVRKGKNVDAGGRVSVQYLEQWSRKHEGCSLLKLIEELIPIFSARYPVTTIQPKPPARPSPPSSTGSSSASPGTLGVGSVSQPPPRPPLPLQSNLEARLTSANSGGYSRPTSYGELRTPAGPPRPPPPPSGISLNHSATLPPGPPPGYHPPPSSNPMPPYTAPQRAASASEYDPEYGSYAPPSRGGQPTPRYDPYQSATNDPRYPQPPRPPSAAFEPTVEPRTDHAHLSRGPSDQSRPFDRAQSSQDSGGPRLPPPVGFTRQGEILPQTAEMPQQGMRNSARRHAAPAPSISSSVNILDAADEDLASPSSVVPTSPSSASTTKQDAPAHVAPPPVPPNPAVLALRTRLHSKLSSALSTLHAETTKNHLEPLSLMHSDLLKAVPAIEDEMARLRAVRDVCLSVRDRYETVVNEGEKRMAEYERKGDGVDVDEIVCGSTVVYTQLLDLVAEDAALEDTIYALGRGLNSGTANIDLDQFLKRVRALAREQFIKRATINKILLGLAIRRERNQQQHRERNGDAARTTASRNGSGQAGRGTPTTT
ncbi:hypothetical protein JCM11491_006011 [Sporobolomyces phaffii]